ncbi:hypothetical protein KHS38_08390 [Mucilaginibacter sp. Bleaf8]|uniref:hypothetical protein n=1 Tax=Mucilaginibacter sp. Bleaf8 TaxID=2834430 RepID=UPI001BCF825A|nr:hypothetical protein [Mucilaginibacter sp. Bleaf8]MBS7564424.1 hypothetical protein [Mucilaginibacter sp. Bleaf8]
MEANSIDAVAMLNEYPYQMLNKNSLAPSLLVGRLGVPVINLPWQHPGLFASHNLQSLIEQ